MKLAPVNGVNVCELPFVFEMEVYTLQHYVSGRWTAVSISYKHYCHLLTMVKSFVA